MITLKDRVQKLYVAPLSEKVNATKIIAEILNGEGVRDAKGKRLAASHISKALYSMRNYKTKTGTITTVVDPSKKMDTKSKIQEVKSLIFKLADSGKNKKEICDELRANKVTRPSSGKIMTREYVTVVLFNRNRSQKLNKRKAPKITTGSDLAFKFSMEPVSPLAIPSGKHAINFGAIKEILLSKTLNSDQKVKCLSVICE